MAKALFITGTDTDVGKTVVTAGALRWLRSQGVNAGSMKPVQTGAEPVGGGLRAPDLEFHHRAAALVCPAELTECAAPYLYEPACSPHLAGRQAGRYPEMAHIRQCANRLMDLYDVLLIEGAGGVLAPLNESETMLDLMRWLGVPVILVAHRGLGTINHSLLSLKALRAADLAVAGVVFNEIQHAPEDFIRKDNPETVCRLGETRLLGNIDYLEGLTLDPERAWARFEERAQGLLQVLEELSR